MSDVNAMNSPASSAKPPRRHRLRWIGAILLLLFVLIVASATWLLGTSSGLRFALARAQSMTHSALQVQQADGRLIGPLDLSGVRYRDGTGLDAQVATVHLDLRIWPLLGKRLHVLDLDVDGVNVALPSNAPPT